MKRRNAVKRRRAVACKVRGKRSKSLFPIKAFIGFCPVLFCVLFFAFSSFADAHNENEKYYASVYVESGDTLWDISDSYCSVDFASRDEFIKEVMQLNHLTSPEIHSGCYIIVPYYDAKPL